MPVKNTKPIIGFDMDGVILDISDIKVRVAKKFGFNIKLSHTPYEIIKTVLPQAVLEELQKLIYYTHEFSMTTPLVKGTKSILAELSAKNIPIFLISRRKMPEIPIKILSKHGLWPKYFNEGNAFFVNHAEGKNKKAAELGLTHFIDDELENISVLSSVPNKILFDKFNVFEKNDQYTKIRSWSEFKKLISNKL